MKKGKKLAAFILTAILAFTSVIPVFAATANSSSATNATVSKKTGWVVKDGTRYYYKDGKVIKDKLGYKIGKKYYRIDKTGVATRVSEAEGLAGIRLEKIGRKLSRAFKYASTGIKY